MGNNLKESIIRTITYFDLFDYPPTLSELKKFLDAKILISDDEFFAELDSMYIVRESQGYYYLLGREKIVGIRQARAEFSAPKIIRAKIIARVLSSIPFIKLIGVSGSLSMNNATEDDDIDLFFITQKNTLWISRFLVTSVLTIIGQKRMKKGRNNKDKICPNMFLSEDTLTLPKKNQSLYSAHEIVQLKVIYDKENYYSKFLRNNKWVGKFLPNGYSVDKKNYKKSNKKKYLYQVLNFVDSLFYTAQKIYMSKFKTIEKITKKTALFHPVNKGKFIMQIFKIKSKMNIERFNSNRWIESEEARYYFDEKKIRILN